MKAAPVYRALRKLDESCELMLVHTGQHYDQRMSDVFVEELELPEPDVFLGVGSGTHGEQTAKALLGVEQVLLDHEPRVCVVAGDVNSTLAAALAASKLNIPVAHIEAGLRAARRPASARLPRPSTDRSPTDRGRARSCTARSRPPDAVPTARLSRFPGATGQGRFRTDRFWRRPGGDVGARHPLLHAQG